MAARLPLSLLLGALFTLSGASLARADVPGPREVCDSEGLTCEVCWQGYGSGPESDKAFEDCKAPLVAKGYTEGCRNRQGAGDNVFFCAPGSEPKKVTKGGGCGGCAIDGEGSATSALLGVTLGIALLLTRRKRA